MLTADLVRARTKSGQLLLTPLVGKKRQRALELAGQLIDATRAYEGARYQDVKAVWGAAAQTPSEAKLAAGLSKLLEDDCHFCSPASVEPRQLREWLFLSAAESRRDAPPGEKRLDRDSVLQRVAADHGIEPASVEAALFADLRSEQLLQRAPLIDADRLVQRYERAEVQAVLLRAVRVEASVECLDAGAYRSLFRALKFRRLLFALQRSENGYRIDIDGPYSLFDAVTKYGLQMALVLPCLLTARRLELNAELRWGKARRPLHFELLHEADPGSEPAPAPLRPEVEALLSAFSKPKDGWMAELAERLLDLPEGEVLVPDLVFRHSSGSEVHVEVMGYWSRDALWRRVEAAATGLPYKLLLVASSRLRVSEAVLEDCSRAALYLYKGVPAGRAMLRHLEQLRAAGAG